MEKLLSTWPGDRGLYGCSEQADKIYFIPQKYAILDFLFEQESETIRMALFRAVKPEPAVLCPANKPKTNSNSTSHCL